MAATEPYTEPNLPPLPPPEPWWNLWPPADSDWWVPIHAQVEALEEQGRQRARAWFAEQEELLGAAEHREAAAEYRGEGNRDVNRD